MVALEGIVLVHFANFWVCDEGLRGLERIGMIVSDWLPEAFGSALSELDVEGVDLLQGLLALIRRLTQQPNRPVFGIIHHYKPSINLLSSSKAL